MAYNLPCIVVQGITAEGAASIADALHMHRSVTELKLAHNALTDIGKLIKKVIPVMPDWTARS